MKKKNFIKNKEVIPDTHFFVYKDKKYPFKFDFFKYASNYFSTNKDELENRKEISLFDTDIEHKITIKDEIIKDFINFVQSKKIPLNKENVILLNYLSTKYEVSKLEEITNEFIKEEESELVLELIYEHQNDLIFNTSKYEKIISAQIEKYIDDDRLLDINIPILYRIFQQYFNEHQPNKTIKKRIYDFFIQIVDKYGREASILFQTIKNEYDDDYEIEQEYLYRLIKEYSNVFEFEYITNILVKILNEQEKTIRNLSKYNDEYHHTISQQKEELQAMKNDNYQLSNEIKDKEKKHLDELETQKQNFTKIINQQEQTITSK